MANKTLFELLTAVNDAQRLVDVYKKESMKTEQAIADATANVKSQQKQLDKINSDISQGKIEIDKTASRIKFEQAQHDGATLEDFAGEKEPAEALLKFKTDKLATIADLKTSLADLETTQAKHEREAADTKSDLDESTATLKALQASDIVKKIEKAKADLDSATEAYAAAKQAEEDAIQLDDSSLIFDQKPSDRYDSIERFKTAAQLSIINRALIETVEEWTSKHAGDTGRQLGDKSNHPNALVRGYFAGMKWSGSNVSEIEDHVAATAAKADEAADLANERREEARRAEKTTMFLKHLEEINAESGEIFTKEDLASFNPAGLSYRIYDGSTIGNQSLGYFDKIFQAQQMFIDQWERTYNDAQKYTAAIKHHKEFESGALKAYRALVEGGEELNEDQLSFADDKAWTDIFADLQTKELNAKTKHAANEDTLKELMAGLKLHSQYDAPVENSYFYQSSVQVDSNVILRHLNYQDFAGLTLEIFELCYNATENALTGHPMMMCGGVGDPNLAEDGFVNDFKNKHANMTLATSRKSAAKEWESNQAFSIAYNERQSTSTILQERVTAVLSSVDANYVTSAKSSAASNGYELLDARLAKALTQTHAIKIERVWVSIKNAILAGKFEINFEGALPALTIQMLLDKGYKVSQGYDNKNYDKDGAIERVAIEGRGTFDAIDLFTNVSWADVEVAAAAKAIADNVHADYFDRAAIKAMNEGMSKEV